METKDLASTSPRSRQPTDESVTKLISSDETSTEMKAAPGEDFDTFDSAPHIAKQPMIKPSSKPESLSGKAASRTSTEEYDHIPFDKLSSRVKKTCHLL